MSEFTDYLHEVFQDFGSIEARRMFGGHGVFRDGLMFALVVEDVLYLKADAETAGDFEARGLARFQYHKQGKTVSLSYYTAPDEIFDDPDEACAWARRAYAAALRASDKPGGPPKKTPLKRIRRR
jgi:DNA transformation protein